ncbi:unnamed protein product [Cylindrotheca closterium]|uniref:Fibronectin type-III domain-containing protein n=1 Tax=Cylindrotheca closterium TaxID=2856 RepID=A0AAD2PX47_9STRA|nr:unnamed protein product [Cylindrotheca closterium]
MANYSMIQEVILVDARSDSMTISWTKVEEAVCYILEFRTVNPLEPDWQRLAEDIQGTSSRKRNLMPESQYFFRISPVYEDDTVGPWITHPESFETLTQEQDEDYAMAAPIVTIPAEPNALIITWEEVDEDVHGFEMQMRENKGGAKWFGFQVSSVSSEVKKKNLTSPWGYQFRVRPVTDFDEPFSPPSNPVQPRRGEKYNRNRAQPAAAPRSARQASQQYEEQGYAEEEYYDPDATPQRQYGDFKEYCMPAPWFKTAGEGAVLICWQRQQGATGYELQMKEIVPGYSQEEGWETIAARLSGTEVKKKNLWSANGYQFRVRPVDGPMSGRGFSNHSNPVVLPQTSKMRQARTTAGAKLSHDVIHAMPAPWFKGANEKNAIMVVWQPQARVTAYTLQMKECAQGEQWQTIAERLTNTEVKKKNLYSQNGYQFRVKPLDGPNKHKEFSKPSSIAFAH